MEFVEPLVLLLLAFACFAAEPVFPSFGLLSVLGAALGVGGILSAFSVDSAFGWGTLVAGLTGTPLCYLLGLRLVPYSPLSDRSTVGEPPAEAPEPLPEAVRPGARGRARTALRPMGTVMIADESIEAASSKGIIPAGTAVRVVDIRGRRVTVAPLAADDDGSAEKNPMDTPGDERAGPAD